MRLLTTAGLLASSLALALVAPSTAQAQTGAAVTLDPPTVSVDPRPDHVRLGWIPPADGDSPALEFSVRDNDEVTLERCARRGGAGGVEDCVTLSANCGAVFDDMAAIFEIIDDLSTKLKASWEAQDEAGDPGMTGHRLLPEPDAYADIEMSHFLQAAWPLLPLEYMFLNWGMDFTPAGAGAGTGDSASALESAVTEQIDATSPDYYAAIRRDHETPSWKLRNKRSARSQIAAGRVAAAAASPVPGAPAWISGNAAGLPEFPVLTLGALLNPAELAVTLPTDASTPLGQALARLTGPKSFSDWKNDLQVATKPSEVADALGDRISTEDQALLNAEPDVVDERRLTVINGLKDRFKAAEGLSGKLSGKQTSDPRAKELPYQVRAALAYLKLIIDSGAAPPGGFGDGAPAGAGVHLMPFHVLFEAPDLTAGLLALFGRERPDYRSVRDVSFVGGSAADAFYEQRAESLLHDMFDYCATQLVLHDEQYVRWDDPYAGGSATTGRLAGFQLARQTPITGGSGFSIERAPAAPANGSMLELRARGAELGETRLWYCYSFGFGGCAETWTPVTVLVEPEGWDDARIVPQRDHFHVVVDWHQHAASDGSPARPGGAVMVFRPSPTGAVTLTDPVAERITDHGAFSPDYGISKGRWINDAGVRPFMPAVDWKYELVSEYCCLLDPDFDWSLDIELPVMDNDEVHFYDLADPGRLPAVDNRLELLDGTVTCDASRYCRHVRAHELPGRRKLPGPGIGLDARSAPSGIVAGISARRDASGETADLFAGGKVRAFERFWLSYCVSPQYIGCLNWTDRKDDFTTITPHAGSKNRGHCVMATSLEPPVAPNAPSLLTLREWARQTGRAEGEYYFKRRIRVKRAERVGAPNVDKRPHVGWGLYLGKVRSSYREATPVEQGHWKLRNFECPAVDPQDPTLGPQDPTLDPQDPTLDPDWETPASSSPHGARSCGRVDADDTTDGKTYDDATSLAYRAYRRFWRCYYPHSLSKVKGGSAVVSDFTDGRRPGHPTQFNVFVTVEFISPDHDAGKAYRDQVDLSEGEGDGIDAKCATAPRPTTWDEQWKVDPATATEAERGVPGHWCFPPVSCWNAEGTPTWQNLANLDRKVAGLTGRQRAALVDRAGCPHHARIEEPLADETIRKLPLGGKDLADCKFSHHVTLLAPKCAAAPAANFALAQGCIFPAFRVIVAPDQTVPNTGGPPPGHGVLRSGHYRWGTADYGGSFDSGGAFESSTSFSLGRRLPGAVDPGMALFPVATGVLIDPSWQFCQDGEMSVVGVWPVHPDSAPGWPTGACDGRRPGDGETPADTKPVYEIDRVCESSFPALYDTDADPTDGTKLTGDSARGIQLPRPWVERFEEMADAGVGCVGEFECERWVIPEPGFYRVRILVDGPAVPKQGRALAIANMTDAERNTKVQPPGTFSAAQHAELQKQHFADPPTFVFDKLIWAQSLHTAWG